MEPLKSRDSVWRHEVSALTRKQVLDLNEFQKPWYIISPESVFIDYWNKLMTVILVYTAIVTPYLVSFIDTEPSGWDIADYLSDAIFLVDFLINCFLAYYNSEKTLIISHKKILSNYALGWMFPDLFACIPFNAIFAQKQYNSLVRVARIPRLYRLLKITKLLKIAKVMKNGSQILKHVNIILKISIAFERIFWFVFTYMLLLHIVACLWVFVGRFDQSSVNWIQVSGFVDLNNYDLYIVSIYWTITTFSTVGYGDIVATNSSEKLFTVAVMTIGIIFYSYSVSSLTNVLSNIDTKKSKLKNQLMVLESLNKEYHLKPSFYLELSKALEFVNGRTRHGIEDFVKDLPGALGNNVLIVAYAKIISENAFFEKKSTDFVAWVAPRLKFCKFNSYESIYTEENYATQMYFVTLGSVEFVLLKETIEIPYIEISKDYYFGEVDLLFSEDQKHLHSTRSGDMCEMLTLSKENFYLLLNTYEVEAMDICGKARERLDRTNEKMLEAENSLRNNIPVDKRRTYPRLEEYYHKEQIRKSILSTEKSVNAEEYPTLFKKIVDSKLKIKDVHGKIIREKAIRLRTEAFELKELLLRLEDFMAKKYPRFSKKFFVPSVNTSPNASISNASCISRGSRDFN